MIDFLDVTKRYGSVIAIDHVTLRIAEPGLYCLLGKNGAGKTTFMKLLAGHIAATGGKITVGGKAVSPGAIPDSVNFIESNAEHFNMKVADLMDAAAVLQDEFDQDFALQMVRRLDLNLQKKFKQLSFGMKTMLTTILTLANNSKVVLLDEPVLGFDPVMRSQFNTLLLESYQAYPRVIIISTHLIDEIAKVTEQLIIINNGQILLRTDIPDIDERAYTLTGPASTVVPFVKNLNCIGKTPVGSMMAVHIYDDRVTPPEGVTLERLALQDFFINIVGGKSDE